MCLLLLLLLLHLWNLLLQLAALEGDKTHLMHERGAVVREQTRITGTGIQTAQAVHVAASEVLKPQFACCCACVSCVCHSAGWPLNRTLHLVCTCAHQIVHNRSHTDLHGKPAHDRRLLLLQLMQSNCASATAWQVSASTH
jgi:hypothetical protein